MKLPKESQKTIGTETDKHELYIEPNWSYTQRKTLFDILISSVLVPLIVLAFYL